MPFVEFEWLTVKPPDKGHPDKEQTSQQRTSRKYSCYIKSPLKEDNLSTKDKTADPKGVLIKRLHCRMNILIKAF